MQDEEADDTDVVLEHEWCEPPQCTSWVPSQDNPEQLVLLLMPPQSSFSCGEESQERLEREAYRHLHPQLEFAPGECPYLCCESLIQHRNTLLGVPPGVCASAVIILEGCSGELTALLSVQEVGWRRQILRSCPAPSSARCQVRHPEFPGSTSPRWRSHCLSLSCRLRRQLSQPLLLL